MNQTTIFSTDIARTIKVPGYLQAVNHKSKKAFFPLITRLRGFFSELDPESPLAQAWDEAIGHPETSRIEDKRVQFASIASSLELFLQGNKINRIKLLEGSVRSIVYRDMILAKKAPYGDEKQVGAFHLLKRSAIWRDGRSEMGRSYIWIECPFCSSAAVKGYIWSLAGGGKRCEECDSLIGWGYALSGNLVVDPRIWNQQPDRLIKYAK